MFIGHYASALVAYERERSAPLWLFLFAGMSLDLLMYALVALGLERLVLASPTDPVAFRNMEIDMTFSHDLVPVLLWTLVVGGLGYTVTRSRAVALWCAGLVAFHEACDLVVGFPHHIMGTDTAAVGAGLYYAAPFGGWLIESAMSLGCVAWFTSRTPLPRWRAASLFGVVGFACWSTLRLSS